MVMIRWRSIRALDWHSTHRHSKAGVLGLYVAVEHWAGVDVSRFELPGVHHLQTGLQHLGKERLGLAPLHHGEDGPGGDLVGDGDEVGVVQVGLGHAGL